MKLAFGIVCLAFQCAALVTFINPAAYATDEPSVEFLLKGLGVGDFARDERVVAINGGTAWATRSSKLANGEFFKNSVLTGLEWPKYGSLISFIMAGAVPHIYNMSNSGFTILYYNAFLDLGVVTRYIGDFESPNKARLDDAYIAPGEILRDEPIASARPAWQTKGYFLESMPLITRDTIVKSTKYSTDIADYFGYFRKKLALISTVSSEMIKGRIINFAYATVNPNLPCGAELTKATISPIEAVTKLKSGNLKNKPEFMKAVVPLYQVGRFIDGADTIALLSARLPDFLIALRAHVVNNECVVDTGLVFDPQADLNKEFIPNEIKSSDILNHININEVDLFIFGAPVIISTSQIRIGDKTLYIDGVSGMEGEYAKKTSYLHQRAR